VTTSRNATIDVTKGLGIILVVLGHNWIVWHDKGELFRVIFSFHMPLFFFLAGIFIRSSDGIMRFVTTRASALLKPYFVVLLSLGVFDLLVAILRNKPDVPGFEYFMGILYGTGNTIAWVPLWFLPHLFISSTIALILLKAFEARVSSKVWLAFSAALLLIIGIYFVDASWQPDATGTYIPGVKGLPGLPWSIDLAPITTAFIIFGYLLGEYTKSMVFNKNGLLVSVLVFISLHYFFDHTIDLNARIYSDPVVSTIQAATGIYITISVASLLQKFPSFSKPLAYLGSGSLFILIFHSALQVKVFWRLSQISTNMYLNGLASIVASILLSLLLWEIAKRQKYVAKLLLPSKSHSLPAAQIQTPSSTAFNE
jgi:polysaccharide biosynthesis protein PslL